MTRIKSHNCGAHKFISTMHQQHWFFYSYLLKNQQFLLYFLSHGCSKNILGSNSYFHTVSFWHWPASQALFSNMIYGNFMPKISAFNREFLWNVACFGASIVPVPSHTRRQTFCSPNVWKLTDFPIREWMPSLISIFTVYMQGRTALFVSRKGDNILPDYKFKSGT